MIGILRNSVFARLFAAQVLALLGTGLATVALGLLAFELAGADAGLVLGVVFTIKMIAYVGLAPIAGAFAEILPRRPMLVALDAVRFGAALMLPFVTEIWQIFVLIFALQAASAGFTPVFQATIPDVLNDEKSYTKALSLSRLAYDLESLLSPSLAAFLLLLVPFNALFGGTALGFGASALLILSCTLPKTADVKRRPFFERTFAGIRNYTATPRLQGLLALNVCVASCGSVVLVGTVVLVQGSLGLAQESVALSLAAYGAGSMLSALLLPSLLGNLSDRRVMLSGAALMTLAIFALGLFSLVWGLNWRGLLVTWFITGVGYSAVLTPSGRLLRRSAHPEGRPAIFAAQFALSHACWLVAYPMSGVLITWIGGPAMMITHAVLSTLGWVVALNLWPAGEVRDVTHTHDDLPPDHPHLQGGRTHRHTYIIDDVHPRWP